MESDITIHRGIFWAKLSTLKNFKTCAVSCQYFFIPDFRSWEFSSIFESEIWLLIGNVNNKMLSVSNCINDCFSQIFLGFNCSQTSIFNLFDFPEEFINGDAICILDHAFSNWVSIKNDSVFICFFKFFLHASKFFNVDVSWRCISPFVNRCVNYFFFLWFFNLWLLDFWLFCLWFLSLWLLNFWLFYSYFGYNFCSNWGFFCFFFNCYFSYYFGCDSFFDLFFSFFFNYNCFFNFLNCRFYFLYLSLFLLNFGFYLLFDNWNCRC